MVQVGKRPNVTFPEFVAFVSHITKNNIKPHVTHITPTYTLMNDATNDSEKSIGKEIKQSEINIVYIWGNCMGD